MPCAWLGQEVVVIGQLHVTPPLHARCARDLVLFPSYPHQAVPESIELATIFDGPELALPANNHDAAVGEADGLAAQFPEVTFKVSRFSKPLFRGYDPIDVRANPNEVGAPGHSGPAIQVATASHFTCEVTGGVAPERK